MASNRQHEEINMAARAARKIELAQTGSDVEAALAAEQDKAKHLVGDLRTALDEARRRLKAAEAGADNAEDQARFAAALKLGVQLIGTCEEIDTTMAKLASLLARYGVEIGDLRQT